MVKVFKNFIKNYTSLDTGKENDIRGFLSQLIGLSFNVISSDCQKLKKTGFSLIITLVKRFKRCVESIGDDEEANARDRFLNNPLILE